MRSAWSPSGFLIGACVMGNVADVTQPNAAAIMRDRMRLDRQVLAVRGLACSMRNADRVDIVAIVRDSRMFEQDDEGTWDETGRDAVWSSLTLTEALGLMLYKGPP